MTPSSQPGGRESAEAAGVLRYANAYRDLRPEVRQHGEDPPVVVGAGREAELVEDVRDVLLHAAIRDLQPLGDALVGAALGHQLEHLTLTGGDLVQRAG